MKSKILACWRCGFPAKVSGVCGRCEKKLAEKRIYNATRSRAMRERERRRNCADLKPGCAMSTEEYRIYHKTYHAAWYQRLMAKKRSQNDTQP